MKISVDAAREYFAHPSQRRFGLAPDDLPEGIEYWARGPVCGAFHQAFWPGVWMGHFGVKPEGWGRLVVPAKEVIAEFSKALRPARIIGWVESDNAAAIAFTKRLGFKIDGEMDPPGVIMFGLDTTWQ